MKAYPTITRGLRVLFFTQFLIMLIGCYSVLSFFFGMAKAIAGVILVLDIAACCGLTAGTAICFSADRKYAPALALAIASVLLSLAALFVSYDINRFLLCFLQGAVAWLLIQAVCSETSSLLQDRDKPCANLGFKASLLYLIPCGIRYFTLTRFVDHSFTSTSHMYHFVSLGWKLGGTVLCLIPLLLFSALLLQYLSSASALLEYSTASDL